MKNISEIYEGLLADMDDTLKAGNDEIMRQHILDQLQNDDLYWYNKHIPIDKAFRIHKKGKKWIVDLKVNFTCYGTEDGYLTDGSFEFGVAAASFSIINKNIGKPLNIKSLKYGPTLVNHNLSIMDCPKLKNLRYCPEKVMENIVIGDTGITTLKYFPEYCDFAEIVHNTNLKEFDAKDITLKSGIRIYKNGFNSKLLKNNLDNKCNFIDDFPTIILDI